jgi:hypothetical protein
MEKIRIDFTLFKILKHVIKLRIENDDEKYNQVRSILNGYADGIYKDAIESKNKYYEAQLIRDLCSSMETNSSNHLCLERNEYLIMTLPFQDEIRQMQIKDIDAILRLLDNV